MKPSKFEMFLMLVLFATLLIAPSCTTWKSTTDVHVQSGDQSVELHRTLDASKDAEKPAQ